MKYHLSFVIAILSSSLVGCATPRNPTLNNDLATETWQREVQTNPGRWTKGADHWFFTGEPNSTEVSDQHAPYSAAISTTQVRVADSVSKVRVDGAFQTQIFGATGHNTLYIYGPLEAVRNIEVNTYNNMVYIHQTQYSPSMPRVIVRIGLGNLTELVQMGIGTVEGIHVRSNSLCIKATQQACGNVYLSGMLNLKSVFQASTGSINVFGAVTPSLTILTYGPAPVNVAGRVGVQSIIHHGMGDVNIIGADTNSLSIYADGVGKIGVHGRVKMRNVQAKDKTRVYAYPIYSDNLSVGVYNDARVGLAGYARNLNVDTFNTTHFDGKDLCAQSVYAQSHDWSHMNITACNKAFATATQNSSIYFYGPAALLTPFTSGNAVILPFEAPNWCNYNSEFRTYSYTFAHPGEPMFVRPRLGPPHPRMLPGAG